MTVLSLINLPKQWYLIVICLVQDVNVGVFVTVINIALYSQITQLKTGPLVRSLTRAAVFFISSMEGITSYMAAESTIYSVSTVLREILVCSLFPQVIGHPAYMTLYLVLDKTDSVRSQFACFRPPATLVSKYHFNPCAWSDL